MQPSTDGKHFAVCIETVDGEEIDLAIPAEEIGSIIQFLTSVAAILGPNTTPPKHFSPIPVEGLGLAAGPTAEDTLLVVRLAGAHLDFQLGSSKVAALADDFSRIAKTLSASGRPQ